MIPSARLSELLRSIRAVRIGVVGDYCLDAYWQLDEEMPELSLETGKPTFSVALQRYSPGGAGNVACNLVALGAGSVTAFGVVGKDLFGNELLRQLNTAGIDSSGVAVQSIDWQTATYAKPYRGTEEQSRIDFGRLNVLSPDTEHRLIAQIGESIAGLDGLVINQQLPRSLFTHAVINFLNSLAKKNPKKIFLLDARSRIPDFKSMICKVNAVEAAALFGKKIQQNESATREELHDYAGRLYERMRKPVFITRSSLGILLFDGSEITELPALDIKGPIDPVGAGDTVVAALAASLAAGASLTEAGALATVAAAVTVQKLRQTGTAHPDEILALIH